MARLLYLNGLNCIFKKILGILFGRFEKILYLRSFTIVKTNFAK